MRKSKYLGTKSGTWECTGIEVAYVQPVYKQKKEAGKRIRSKYPGHRQYEYLWERLTSDKKAMKTIRLNAAQVRQVLDGKYTVEQFAQRKEAKRSMGIKNRVSYCFCD